MGAEVYQAALTQFLSHILTGVHEGADTSSHTLLDWPVCALPGEGLDLAERPPASYSPVSVFCSKTNFLFSTESGRAVGETLQESPAALGYQSAQLGEMGHLGGGDTDAGETANTIDLGVRAGAGNGTLQYYGGWHFPDKDTLL